MVVSIIVSTLPVYQTEGYRHLRMCISMFNSLPYLVGLVTAVIIVHDNSIPVFYSYLLYAVIIECLAGFFYVSMFPEIMFPKLFDCILNSHSIWHWLNFGFDFCMMLLSYAAFKELEERGFC